MRLIQRRNFEFENWAVAALGGIPNRMQVGEKGIDDRLFFHEGSERDGVKQVILAVKGGRNVTVKDVRDLIGVVSREKAPIGVLNSMTKPTKPMKAEAAGAGFYNSPGHTNHAKIQILTVEDLLGGKSIDMPGWRTIQTFKKAPKANRTKAKDAELFD